MQELDQHAAKIVSYFSAAIEDLDESIQELSDTITKQ
jgi:hypothetical protein